MNPEPEATELLVERVRVGGRRPTLSAVIVGIVIVSFIGLAILKPWVPLRDPSTAGLPPSGTSNAASPASVIAAPSDRPTGSPPRPVAEATPLPFVPHAAELHGATARRNDWGIRAVVVPSVTQRFDVDGPVLTERWIAIDVAHGAAWNLTNGGTAAQDGDAVVALGATMPDDALPLAIRIWRLDGPGVPHEIAAVSVPGPVGVSQLWLPDPANSTAIGTWPSGTYRIDVTVGERVVRLVMIVRE